MNVERFLDILSTDFYAGVPDSQLKALCDCLISRYGVDGVHHAIAANEGNCVALAAGYHLATGKVPVVYMQNSGIGNAVNPIASLLNEKVYAIPCIFVIGWRGEPGVHDEPQHIFQGEITLKLLEDLDVMSFVIGKDTYEAEVTDAMSRFQQLLVAGKQVAFVVRKGALKFDERIVKYSNENTMRREEVIRRVVTAAGDDIIVSTTGKASRELFEIREANAQSHDHDFLTVGSMGHSSSIALEIALQRPEKKVWIIDGDGAVLMHMGAMAVIGSMKPKNIVHVIVNNGAHESVGGQPTVMDKVNLICMAKAFGYSYAVSVESFEELEQELAAVAEHNKLCLVEVKCAIGARNNLGRPTTTAKENKVAFMKGFYAENTNINM